MQDISLEQAISVLLEHTKKIEAVEEVPLLEALGRVLAEDAEGVAHGIADAAGRVVVHDHYIGGGLLHSRSSARSAPGISSRQKCQRARLCA